MSKKINGFTLFMWAIIGAITYGIITTDSENTNDTNSTKTEIKTEKKEAIKEPVKATKKKTQEVKITPKNKTLVFNTGYALQAGMICDNLMYRFDTTNKVSLKVGVENIREGVYKETFFNGVKKALKEESINKEKMCSKAWELFGCNGSREKRLLSESFTYYDEPQICPYN